MCASPYELQKKSPYNRAVLSELVQEYKADNGKKWQQDNE